MYTLSHQFWRTMFGSVQKFCYACHKAFVHLRLDVPVLPLTLPPSRFSVASTLGLNSRAESSSITTSRLEVTISARGHQGWPPPFLTVKGLVILVGLVISCPLSNCPTVFYLVSVWGTFLRFLCSSILTRPFPLVLKALTGAECS
jgi:hypothetical protein